MKTSEKTLVKPVVALPQGFKVQAGGVAMHPWPHNDEMVGRFILVIRGADRFAGIADAPVHFTSNGELLGTDEEFDAKGLVPIGCGMDRNGVRARFNDHNGERGRVPGECASTLIAKSLGVENDPTLKDLLAETLWFDTNHGCPPTLLADIVKVFNRRMMLSGQSKARGSQIVLAWANKAYDAIVTRKTCNLEEPAPDELTLLEIYNILEKRGFADEAHDPRILDYMRSKIESGMRSNKVTSLAYIVAAMFRRPTPVWKPLYSVDEVVNWTQAAFEAIYHDQKEFWKEVARLEKMEPYAIHAFIGGEKKELCLRAFESDSNHASKAARRLGADVVAVRNSSGNVQIYIDSNIEGLSLSDAAKMINWLELGPEDQSKAKWKELAPSGQLPGAPMWYYFKEGQMLLNGSQTHSAQPTRIRFGLIIDALQHAFHWLGVKMWCNRYHIRISDPERRPAKPAPPAAPAPKKVMPVELPAIRPSSAPAAPVQNCSFRSSKPSWSCRKEMRYMARW